MNCSPTGSLFANLLFVALDLLKCLKLDIIITKLHVARVFEQFSKICLANGAAETDKNIVDCIDFLYTLDCKNGDT